MTGPTVFGQVSLDQLDSKALLIACNLADRVCCEVNPTHVLQQLAGRGWSAAYWSPVCMHMHGMIMVSRRSGWPADCPKDMIPRINPVSHIEASKARSQAANKAVLDTHNFGSWGSALSEYLAVPQQCCHLSITLCARPAASLPCLPCTLPPVCRPRSMCGTLTQ